MINKVTKLFSEYGFVAAIYIIVYELFYVIKNFPNLIELEYDFTSKYEDLRNVEYVPTPYYLLNLLKKKLNSNYININKYKIIDYGCGKGRVNKFFFGVEYLGIDINNNFKNFVSNFLNLNLRKNFKFINEEESIHYFFKPFEDELILLILNSNFKRNDIAVIINFDNSKILFERYKKIYFKSFKKGKNLIILKYT